MGAIVLKQKIGKLVRFTTKAFIQKLNNWSWLLSWNWSGQRAT